MSIFKGLEDNSKNGTWLYDTRDQLKQYALNLSQAAFERNRAAMDDIKTIPQLVERQKYARENFLKSIGGLPEYGGPLNAKITGVNYFDGYRVENILFESRPQVYVSANMYIPENLSSPSAAVHFVCGHHAQGKHVDEYQIVCQYFVRAGFVVFAQDPFGQGERFGYHDAENNRQIVGCSVPEHDHAGFQIMPFDHSLARYFLHDITRGHDYLETRPEVDKNKIAITGNSGGGTQSSMAMLGDPRLAAAAPATFIMSRESYMYTGQAQDREQIWHGFTEYGLDHEDIIAVMAPKPVLILAVQHDFFPIEGVTATYERAKRLWELSGSGGKLQLFVDDCDHHYTREMAKAAARFLAGHLMGKESLLFDDEKILPVDQKLLWCTKSGQIRGEIEGAKFAWDDNLEVLAEVKNNHSLIPAAQRREEAARFLTRKIFKNRSPKPPMFRKAQEGIIGGLAFESILWISQAHITNHAYIFVKPENAKKKNPTTLALWHFGTNCLDDHAGFIHSECEKGRAVMVLDVSGIGLVEQRAFAKDQRPTDFYGPIFLINDNLVWQNDSLCALRCYDLLRAADIAGIHQHTKSEDIKIYTHGKYSVYADIVKFFDGRVSEVVSEDGIESYAEFIKSWLYDHEDIQSVIMPGLLNIVDLDELRG
ncbi:MAG: prolyl oligopeptidase family serine peptidase [Oscillospiraceae bacterium]|nr:prolyl oligopeptidase family serine peptidase [Oscillospiraceae bacterium]